MARIVSEELESEYTRPDGTWTSEFFQAFGAYKFMESTGFNYLLDNTWTNDFAIEFLYIIKRIAAEHGMIALNSGMHVKLISRTPPAEIDNSTENQKSMGGKREGSGRPRIGTTKKISITLPDRAWESIEREAKGNVSKFIREVLENYFI